MIRFLRWLWWRVDACMSSIPYAEYKRARAALDADSQSSGEAPRAEVD